MNTTMLISIFSAAFAALGVIISALAFSRKEKKDTEVQGEHRGALASDVGYIKAGVDDLKRESRETRHDIRELTVRLTRCEESCKQAHKRLDEYHQA